MSLEQKFLGHSDLAPGSRLRLWIGGVLFAWALMLAAILNMVAQPDSRVAEDTASLNEIAPAAGQNQTTAGQDEKAGTLDDGGP